MRHFTDREITITGLPPGKWVDLKSDKVAEVEYRPDKFEGPVPYRCPDHFPAKFGFQDLRVLGSLSHTKRGMKAALERWGPFSIGNIHGMYHEEDIPAVTRTDVALWACEVIDVQKAFFLWDSLRRGDELKWEPTSKPLEEAQFKGWPRRLAWKPQPVEFGIFYPDLAYSRRIETPEKSRSLGKALLASYIDEGLKDIRLRFVYVARKDSFEPDVPKDQVFTVEQACWLLLRDLSTGLVGLRFCENPNCSKRLDPSMNSHARACPNASCRKAASRARRKAAANG